MKFEDALKNMRKGILMRRDIPRGTPIKVADIDGTPCFITRIGVQPAVVNITGPDVLADDWEREDILAARDREAAEKARAASEAAA